MTYRVRSTTASDSVCSRVRLSTQFLQNTVKLLEAFRDASELLEMIDGSNISDEKVTEYAHKAHDLVADASYVGVSADYDLLQAARKAAKQIDRPYTRPNPPKMRETAKDIVADLDTALRVYHRKILAPLGRRSG